MRLGRQNRLRGARRGRRWLTRGFLLVFLILAALLIPAPPSVGAATLTVCPTCQFTTIEAAINAASFGDTVQVLSSYTSSGESFPITTELTPGGITITGEVDANGQPITVVDVARNPLQPDGFIIVRDGFKIRNLKILGTSGGQIQRVIAAADFATGLHLNSLEISNVVVDFSGSWNAFNGLDLIANNVLIDRTTITGITGSAISIDGDNYTISNSNLNGMDSANTVRASLAIAFGDDLETPTQQDCSGIPNDYTISGNTIVGFVEGVKFCTGSGITISNNIIRDISQKAIETSGSRLVTVSYNTITWDKVAGIHGIGFSTNVFQTCESNLISDNQILGRVTRDVQRGIVVQNCKNTQIQRNTLRNFASDALIVTMPAGVSTSWLIEANLSENNNGNGIAYLGSDQQGTSVDGTVLRNNVSNNNRQNGIIFTDVAGAGNAFTGNQASSNNQGAQANIHAFNLQRLRNSLIDGNTASNTVAPGAGYFIVDSSSLTVTNNVGTPCDSGGRFVLVNVVASVFYNNSCIANNASPTSAWVSAAYLVALPVTGALSSGPTGDQSTTSTSFVTSAQSVTVSASGSQQYLILASSQLWGSSASIGASMAICRDGLSISGDQFSLGATATHRNLASALVLDTPPAGSRTYSLCFKTDPGGTAFVSGTFLVVLPVSGGSFSGPHGDQSTTSTSFVPSAETIPISADGSQRYLALATSQMWADSTSIGSSMAICRDGTRISGDMFQLGSTPGHRQLSMAIVIDQPTAGSHTYSLCFKTDPGGRGWVSSTLLAVVPLTVGVAVSSGPFGDQSTTSNTFVASAATMSISTTGSYLLLATSQLWNDLSTTGSSMAICRDGIRISGDMFSLGPVMSHRHLAAAIALDTPSTGSHTYSLCFKTDSAFIPSGPNAGQTVGGALTFDEKPPVNSYVLSIPSSGREDMAEETGVLFRNNSRSQV